MNVSILTVFPRLYDTFLDTSLIKRAQEEGNLSFSVAGLTEFCSPKERLDGPTVGHGAGMAIRPEVLKRAVDSLEEKHGTAYRIFLTPQGQKLDQRKAQEIANILKNEDKKHLMLVAGRYEGIDARAQRVYADLEISIGDYVLMGGDLPAMVLLEAVLRYIPGVVGRSESVEKDSFTGPFVDFPTYTVPPREWEGQAVPEILLSGNHAAIDAWRQEQAAEVSVRNHFGWVRTHCVKDSDRELAYKYIPNHYLVLMHDEVIVEQGRIGTSSVTSLDIHDIARSSKTYGLKGYYLVTSLEDQKKIVKKILEFWDGAGIEYNKQRHDAVKLVSVVDSLDLVMQDIEQREGRKPVLVGTSARHCSGARGITYGDQRTVWDEERPVLFVFGTAKGLAPQVIERCEYVLAPLEGFTKFNHLSVRSAAAVILDRWLGINLTRLD